MTAFVIQGGRRLQGKIKVHGAKNSILPIIAASLLNRSREPVILNRVPGLSDVRSMLSILSDLGAKISPAGDNLVLKTDLVDCYEVPERLMREMRSSIFIMGPLLARLGRARVCQPGGCAIGPRPINLHLEALQQMGATIEVNGDYIEARGKLKGAEITLKYPSVGATENIIMAASLARGKTVIHNPAREPEIVDLQNFLNLLGARISGAGSEQITIEGVDELGGGRYRVFPDRIVAGTYVLAAAITGGELILEQVVPEHLSSLVEVIRRAGVSVTAGESTVTIKAGREIRPVGQVYVEPYPGFPTDLQPQLIAYLSLAGGRSEIIERVFQERFAHVMGLRKMGARITLRKERAQVHGVKKLNGTAVEATDLRGGAALVLAALAAEGESKIWEIRHIDRGYERLEEVLNKLGAAVERVSDPPVSREAVMNE